MIKIWHENALRIALYVGLTLCLQVFLPVFNSPAFAGDYRLSGGLGYGGTGITQTSTTNTAQGTVKRSEGPGIMMIGLERIMSDTITLSIDHMRGFRLGPYSSGVSFTGFAGRYYFQGPAPWGAKEIDTKKETTLLVKRFHPFAGMAAGIASGTIDRPGDAVPSVSASGIYVGIRVGADVPFTPTGIGLRPEIASSFTLLKGLVDPSSLSLFSVGCSFYFQL